MDFDLDKDINIFDKFFKSRPEVSADKLKIDLEKYYLPYAKKLVELKKNKDTLDGLIVGVSAIQGAGKTTQGEILEILLKHFGHSSISRSIDDHYITHKELCDLRQQDARFIRRGVTHDVALAILNLRDLQKMRDDPIIVSGYDKGLHHGDGDRLRWVNVEGEGVRVKLTVYRGQLTVAKEIQEVLALKLKSLYVGENEIPLPERMGSDVPAVENVFSPELIEFLNNHIDQDLELTEADNDNVKFSGNGEITTPKKGLPNGWRIVTEKPDFIFYDGWMLGARPVEDESIFDSGLPALEKVEDKEFAKKVNKKLDNYIMLWAMIEFMTVLYVPNFNMSLEWRDQAEEKLREKGEGMTHDQIVEFVHYFWRSVHPGIHIKNLAHDEFHAQQVVIINDDHSVGEILTPEEVKQKYP